VRDQFFSSWDWLKGCRAKGDIAAGTVRDIAPRVMVPPFASLEKRSPGGGFAKKIHLGGRKLAVRPSCGGGLARIFKRLSRQLGGRRVVFISNRWLALLFRTGDGVMRCQGQEVAGWGGEGVRQEGAQGSFHQKFRAWNCPR